MALDENGHKQDLQNAATMAAARYKVTDDDLMEFLNEDSHLQFHTLNQVVMDDDVPHLIRNNGGGSLSYVLALGMKRSVVYVAVRGGLNRRDWMALLRPRAENDDDDGIAGGRGCPLLARMLLTRLQVLFHQVQKDPLNKIQRVVFTGHSMGGAIATLAAALFSLQQQQAARATQPPQDKDEHDNGNAADDDDNVKEKESSWVAWEVSCITFGAPPPFSNEEFRQALFLSHLKPPRIMHYRGFNDVVPAALMQLSAFRNISDRETLTLLSKVGLDSNEDDCSYKEICQELQQWGRTPPTTTRTHLVEIGTTVGLEDAIPMGEPRHSSSSLSSFFVLAENGMKHHDMTRYLDTIRTLPAHVPVLENNCQEGGFVSRGSPKPAKRPMPKDEGAFEVIVLLPLFVGAAFFFLECLWTGQLFSP